MKGRQLVALLAVFAHFAHLAMADQRMYFNNQKPARDMRLKMNLSRFFASDHSEDLSGVQKGPNLSGKGWDKIISRNLCKLPYWIVLDSKPGLLASCFHLSRHDVRPGKPKHSRLPRSIYNMGTKDEYPSQYTTSAPNA